MMVLCLVFLFKQKTAYEMRISDWSSDVCSSDLDREGMIKMPLNLDPRQGTDWRATLNAALDRLNSLAREAERLRADTGRHIRPILLVQVARTGREDRKSVASGKSVSVRVDLGGGRVIQKKNNKTKKTRKD